MGDLWLLLAICVGLGSADSVIWTKVWRRQFSPYSVTEFAGSFVGSNGRYGYDAAVPSGSMMFLWAAVGTIAMMFEGSPLADGVIDVFIPLLLLTMATSLCLLLFLRPRFLVPPHLRDKRGWIPEWWVNDVKGRKQRKKEAPGGDL